MPLLIGLMGPSGGGKTKSALRLAEGIRQVTGGDIYGIDTEANRMLHYADRHSFEHVPFGAPFGPLDYLNAIDYCTKQGAKVVIVDSMSHEHDGPGGVLEMHEQETARLAAAWGVKPDKAKMAAWNMPKTERRKLIQSVLQMRLNFIFCFRAKPKLKIEAGKDPQPLGFMPIAGEEFVYEMTLNCLLLPGAGGVPTWHSDELGERAMIKLPEHFVGLFADTRRPLDEKHGIALAKWASGDPSTIGLYAQLRQSITETETLEGLNTLLERLREVPDKKLLPAAEYKELKRLFADRKQALENAALLKQADERVDPETGVVTSTSYEGGEGEGREAGQEG